MELGTWEQKCRRMQRGRWAKGARGERGRCQTRLHQHVTAAIARPLSLASSCSPTESGSGRKSGRTELRYYSLLSSSIRCYCSVYHLLNWPFLCVCVRDSIMKRLQNWSRVPRLMSLRGCSYCYTHNRIIVEKRAVAC